MSKDGDGSARGLHFDAQEKLVGHAKLRWVDEVQSGEHDPSADPDEPDGYWSVSSSDTYAPDISRLVPLALVAAAGVAAGAAGVKIAQHRKRRRQEERLAVAAESATPAGWYDVTSDAGQLRYWNGSAWTGHYAQRARSAPSIGADWYPDPSNLAQLRYWDGTAWTHHVAPRPGAVTTPAGWYPDPFSAAHLRYWDGGAWTSHVTGGAGAAMAMQQAPAPATGRGRANSHEEPRIQMSSAEWRAHVEAWARAGAIQEEMWRRLTNAHIADGDEVTLAAQRQWQELTPQEGARRIQLMLEANPALRAQGVLEEFVRLFGGAHSPPHRVEINRRRP